MSCDKAVAKAQDQTKLAGGSVGSVEAIADALTNRYIRWEHFLNDKDFSKWFENLYEDDANQYEYYELYAELTAEMRKSHPHAFPTMSKSEFDKGWQYRIVLTPDGIEASKVEFINLCMGVY